MASDRGRIFLFVETGAWLVLAAGMWIYSFRFDGDFPAYLWGPVSWPRAVLAAVVVLALAQFAMRLVTASPSRPGAETVSGEGREAWDERPEIRDGRGEAHAGSPDPAEPEPSAGANLGARASRPQRAGDPSQGPCGRDARVRQDAPLPGIRHRGIGGRVADNSSSFCRRLQGSGTQVAGNTGEARAGSREARRKEAGGTGVDSRETEGGVGETQRGRAARFRILSTFGLPFVYLVLLPRTGYFVTTPLFLVAYMLVFRERSLKYMLATAALLYLGSLAIFSKLLFVPLPTGNWPGFYDFSNWLLKILNAL